jgi:hypothetical protein
MGKKGTAVRDCATGWKKCKRCEYTKEVSSFRKDASCNGGYRNICKACAKSTPVDDVLELTAWEALHNPTYVNTSGVDYYSPPTLTTRVIDTSDLPNVEDLPAAYLKQCYDYWKDLIDDESPNKRIA